jgi:hypothetical protein
MLVLMCYCGGDSSPMDYGHLALDFNHTINNKFANYIAMINKSNLASQSQMHTLREPR